MEAINIKEEARRLIDRLPENATWDDLMYEIYVRVAIEAGLADSQAGRITSVETVRQQFGLPTWRFFGQTQPSSIFPGFMPTSPKIHLNMGVEWLIAWRDETFEQIAAFPASGRMVPEFEREEIREVIEGSYRMIYYIKPEQIDVLAVIHGSQQITEDYRPSSE